MGYYLFCLFIVRIFIIIITNSTTSESVTDHDPAKIPQLEAVLNRNATFTIPDTNNAKKNVF